MLLDNHCPYTAEQLRCKSQGRYFDQIVFVTTSLWRTVQNLNDIYHLKHWGIETRTQQTHPGVQVLKDGQLAAAEFSEICASTHMGDVEFRVVQPESGETAPRRYLDRYGEEGLCCIRENVPQKDWDATLAHYQAQGIPVVQRETGAAGEIVWLDAMDVFGGLLGLYCGPAPRVAYNDRKLTQINVVTDDVDRTVAQLTQLLRIGPWSIGTLNNQSVTNPGLLVGGKMTAPEFHFQLGITFVGNMEFEVIQPVKGPTVYRDYLEQHGCGYHHIKEVVPPESWRETLDSYQSQGIPFSIQGQVGPTCFTYLDSQEKFGFIVELGDGLAADPLPEGYNEYQYPEK